MSKVNNTAKKTASKKEIKKNSNRPIDEKAVKGFYQWDPELDITISGREFHVLFNSIKDYLNGKGEPINTIKLFEAFKILEFKLGQMVEEGTAVLT